MEITVDVELNLDIKKVTKEVIDANRLAMRDTVVLIAHDAIELSRWITGNNRRSIFFGTTNEAHKQASGEGKKPGDTWTGEDKSVISDNKIEGAVYSTSGYGGYLETGTSKMPAQPYFKPALDMNFTQDKFAERVKRHLK